MNNIEQAISFARQEYTRQGLDALYQKDFEEALLPALSQAAEIYRADTLRWSGDPKTDLLAALLWSQKLLNDYQRHQLPDEVFYHTIDDIGRWASEYWSYSGKIGLAESAWLTNHLTLRLFQLGRLQFCMEPADFSAPAFGLEPGEPLVSVHICRGGSLDPAACDTSFARARAFFQNTSRRMRSGFQLPLLAAGRNAAASGWSILQYFIFSTAFSNRRTHRIQRSCTICAPLGHSAG